MWKHNLPLHLPYGLWTKGITKKKNSFKKGVVPAELQNIS